MLERPFGSFSLTCECRESSSSSPIYICIYIQFLKFIHVKIVFFNSMIDHLDSRSVTLRDRLNYMAFFHQPISYIFSLMFGKSTISIHLRPSKLHTRKKIELLNFYQLLFVWVKVKQNEAQKNWTLELPNFRILQIFFKMQLRTNRTLELQNFCQLMLVQDKVKLEL